MSDMLSQDQLDNLLAQQDNDASVHAIEGDDDIGVSMVKNYDALRAACDFFGQSGASVITNVLNREASISVGECAALDVDSLNAPIKPPALLITVQFKSGIEGQVHFVMGTAHVAMVADLMLMGEGTAEYIEDHKDALGELFNQIIGAYSTALGGKLSKQISTGEISVKDYDPASPPFNPGSDDMALLTLCIAGHADCALGMVIPDAISGAWISVFSQAPESAPHGSQGDEKGVGLSSAELDDLSQVAGDFGGGDIRGSGFGRGQSEGMTGGKNVEMLLDVQLDVSIELGRTNLSIKKILELSPGAIVELDRMAGEPVDLMVNDKIVAKGEVVVVDENFGIRIVSLVSPEERIKSLR